MRGELRATAAPLPSDASVARAPDGVHQEVRVAASAKFLFEVFPQSFAHEEPGVLECKGEAPASSLVIASDAVTKLWQALAKHKIASEADRRNVKAFWDRKIAEPSNHWDQGVFYSQQHRQVLSVSMPLQAVLAAIVTLLLDRRCFREKKADQAERDRLTQLFDNMRQVAESAGLCHTGVRDALLTPINGVPFWLAGKPCCYRFPEQLTAHLQYLQAKYIEAALIELNQENPREYHKQMIAWFKMSPETREMPEALKVLVSDHFRSTAVQADINAALFSCGVNPGDTDVKTQCSLYFSKDSLAWVNPSSALGSDAYWRDVELLLSLKPTTASLHLASLQAQAALHKDAASIKSFHQRLKDFFRIHLAESLLKTYEPTLVYHYPETSAEVCVAAKDSIAAYHESDTARLLNETEKSAVRALQLLVRDYQQSPLTNTFNNAFALLFRSSTNEGKQARLLGSAGMVRQYKITDSWLDHFFPVGSPAGTEIDIKLATLNQVLLYVLYYPKNAWPERTPAVLSICLDYIENRLGETEEDPTERDRHQQLKADSYPKKLRSLLRLLMQDAIFSDFSDVQLNKALLIAARFGFLQIVQLLCQCDRVNINTVNSGRETPLILAAFNGHDACLQVLLRYPALDWNRLNIRGNTALICAAISGHADCIATLMKAFVASPDRYADIKRGGEGKKTALAWAVELGHVDCVFALLENGYHPDFQEVSKLLTLAIKQGDVESLKRLSSIIDDDPRRPEPSFFGLGLPSIYTDALRDAVSLQQLECVKYLLTNRYTSVNGQFYSSPPLSIAVKKNDVACVKILLQHPDVRVGAAGRGQFIGPRGLFSSPIAEGVKHGAVDCLRLMFKHASFFKDSVVLGSLLIWAVKGGYKAGVRFLLSDPDIDVNFKSVYGRSTALILAVTEHVDLEIIRDLLNHPDIDVNVGSSGRVTALMQAAHSLNAEAVRLLLAHKNIDMNVKDVDGRTVHQRYTRRFKKLRYVFPDNPNVFVIRNLLSVERPSSCFSLRMFCCGRRALVGAPSLQAEPESKRSHGKS